jgi:hypothetical protein
MSGAVASHVLASDPIGKYIAPMVFTMLAMLSWRFEPGSRPVVL